MCPLAYLKNHTAKHPNFLCILTVVVARSSSGGVAIRYVLPVLRTDGAVFSHNGLYTAHRVFLVSRASSRPTLHVDH